MCVCLFVGVCVCVPYWWPVTFHLRRTAQEWSCGKSDGLCYQTCVSFTTEVNKYTHTNTHTCSGFRVFLSMLECYLSDFTFPRNEDDLPNQWETRYNEKRKKKNCWCLFTDSNVTVHWKPDSWLSHYVLCRRQRRQHPGEYSVAQLSHLHVISGRPHQPKIRLQGRKIYISTTFFCNLDLLVSM